MVHQNADTRYYASGDVSALNRFPRPKRKTPAGLVLPEGPLPHTLNLERPEQLEQFRGWFVRVMKSGRAPRMCITFPMRPAFEAMLAELVQQEVITLRTSRSLRVQWCEAEPEPDCVRTCPDIERGPVTGVLPDALPADHAPATKVISQQTSSPLSIPAVESTSDAPRPSVPKKPAARKKVARSG